MKAKNFLLKMMVFCLCVACATIMLACELHIHEYAQSTVEPTCDQDGLITYTCLCGHTYTEAIPARHDEQIHEGQEPTCTEAGWKEYVTCNREGCDYTTYEQVPARHDEQIHEGQEPTCTEIGWEEYVTCKREGCDYTTYAEIAALGHDEQIHEGQEPTSTEIGWEEYVTCKREGCDYTTYVEIPMLKEDLSLALIIIIDTSNSMLGTINGVTCLDHAIVAARSTIDELSGNDYVGVLNFNSSDNLILPLTACSDTQAIDNGFNSIRSGGATVFSTALELAGQMLKELDGVDEKRIIAITDGDFLDTPEDYEETIRDYNEEGINLSIAAISYYEDSSVFKGSDYSEEDLTDEIITRDLQKTLLRAVVIGGGNLYFFNESSQLVAFLMEEYEPYCRADYRVARTR